MKTLSFSVAVVFLKMWPLILLEPDNTAVGLLIRNAAETRLYTKKKLLLVKKWLVIVKIRWTFWPWLSISRSKKLRVIRCTNEKSSIRLLLYSTKEYFADKYGNANLPSEIVFNFVVSLGIIKMHRLRRC